MQGLKFKMNPAFNEGDHIILDDTDAIIVKIGLRESVFGVYSKRGYTWRFIPNDRLKMHKLEKVINKDLHLDSDTEVKDDKDTAVKKVKFELEVDTNVVDSGKNPYMHLIFLARAVDAWRIFPRIFLSVYIYLLYDVTTWFMNLPEPNLEQSGLVSIVVGAGAAWFGLYAGTSKKNPDK
jgi:hypothetical protein